MKIGLYCSSFSFILLFFVSLSMNATGQPIADIGLKSNGDAWQFYRSPDEEKPMPRVLLIGDSIVNGYRHTARTELNNKALIDVWLTPLNLKSPTLLEDLKTVLAQGPYTVVHFNIGLHGWTPGRIPEEEYEPLLRAYVNVIRENAPDAHLIWASTTQITVKDKPEALDPEHNPTITTRNAVAVRVMNAMGVEIDDLYGLMCDKLHLAKGDKFHWLPEAQQLQGKQVAKYILRHLDQSHTKPKP